MIVEPFPFGAYTARDLQDVAPREQLAIGRALRDGLFLMPAEYKCEALGLSVDGDYVALRLGVYSGSTLIGGWWLGSHEAAAGHTMESARVYSRLCPGPVPGHEAEFWTGEVALLFVKHLLHNTLQVRGGAVAQFVGFDYALNPNQVAGSPASILADIDALAKVDPELQVQRTPLATGGFDNRWTLAP
jgi:hypothetical protein